MDIEKIKSELKTIADNIDSKIEKANGQAKEAANESAQKVAKELKDEISGLVGKHSELSGLYEKEKKAMQEQLDDLSTKMKKGQFGADEHKGYEQLIKEAVEAQKEKGVLDQFIAKGNSGRSLSFEVTKAAMLTTSGGPGAGTIVPQRRAGIINPMTNDMLVRSLMNVTTTNTPVLSYVREVAVTGGPAGVAEGALKPQVSITTEVLQATAKKIAAHAKLSEELMADVPGFTGYITGRMTDLLQKEENRQILYGTLTTELTGLATVASPFAYPGYIVAAPQNWDVLAATNALLVKTPYKLNPTAHVINPAQFYQMASYKDANNNYIAPIIFTNGVPTIFGQPLVVTSEITAGDFLSGNFRVGAEIYQREGISVRVYDQNEDDAVKNMVTIVIEERLMMPIYIPGAFIYDQFADARAAITTAPV